MFNTYVFNKTSNKAKTEDKNTEGEDEEASDQQTKHVTRFNTIVWNVYSIT